MSDSHLRNRWASHFGSLLRGAHSVARGILKTQGYHWHIRRRGEIQLGYWRKTFQKSQKGAYPFPKRFVLIPGFGDSSLSWFGVLFLLHPILKKQFDEVILFDFPGFGGFLSKERAFPSMDMMMSTVFDALDSLKPHTLMGHSLGGWLAALYGVDCGRKTRPHGNTLTYSGPESLILVCPSGMFDNEATKLEWEGIFRSAMKNGFSALRPHLFAREPFWFRFIVSDFSKFISREDVLQFMDTFREDHQLDAIARHIQAKVWLIWGAEDTLIRSRCGPAWLTALRGESAVHSQDAHREEKHHVILLQGVGHSPHVESPAIMAVTTGQILVGKTPHPVGRRWWKELEKSSS